MLDSDEYTKMEKERTAMEELKEIDMNYLNNEESDPDEMFQQ